MSDKDDVRAWVTERPGVLGMLALGAVGAGGDIATALGKFRKRHGLRERSRRGCVGC